MASFFSNRLPGGNEGFLFEIRLDDGLVVLRGNEHEAAGQLLKGRVELRSTRALRVDAVHLRMAGRMRITWREELRSPPAQVSHNVDKTIEVFSHEVILFGCGRGTSSSTMLSPGIHEWPFEIHIPGSTPESIEGPHKSSISYRLEATVIRPKIFSNKHISKPVRIIRTHQSLGSEFAHDSTAEGIWMQKAEYWISIPQRTVLLGSSLQTNIRIKPLLDGMKVSNIRYRLLEVYQLQISTSSHEACKEVAQWTSDGHKNTLVDYGPEDYVFSGSLSLPRSLSKCTQDVSVRGIKVRHVLSIAVEVHDRDNQRSQLHVTLPIILLISPNAVVDSVGNLIGIYQNDVNSDLVNLVSYMESPPPYREHILDEVVR
ncbi:hypothetical protein BKA63DRAFT_280865 [Paraphoma chrysanthemicola]|nr:hypothetical protein BKA63DRAFT_280865 [Paraphoma chrysanthemicola]